MNILAIDTGTDVCSVSVFNEDGLLAVRESMRDFSHASMLTIFIQECLHKCNFSIKNLDAIAIASGPGSYTGLRVGASTAKGICYSLDLPLIAIDALTTLSYSTLEININEGDTIIPMIDARRNEAYISTFDHQLKQLSAPSKQIIDTSFFEKFEGHRIVVCGNGYEKFINLLPQNCIRGAIDTSAKYLWRPSIDAFMNNDFQEIISFTPFYLNDPNITKSNKNILFET